MLEIAHLQKTYPNGVHALRDINLSIPNGMYGLLGPNGAGKSTLMRTVATLQAPDSGSLHLGDIDILKYPHTLRQHLGYLPQDFGVYPRVNAVQMLDHIAVLKGLTHGPKRKAAVEGLLKQTNLWEVRKKSLSGYSGGMRQRFGIAQALLGDPRLIIVDEPTAGLDPEECQRFHNLLSEIGEKVVVLLSTHIVEDVANLCSRAAIMVQGQIVTQGPPADLVANLKGKIWRKRINKPELAEHQEKYQVISTRLVSGELVLQVYAEDQPSPEFTSAEATLEDVYFTTLSQTRPVEGEA